MEIRSASGRPGVRPVRGMSVRKQEQRYQLLHDHSRTSAARKRNESSFDRAVSG